MSLWNERMVLSKGEPKKRTEDNLETSAWNSFKEIVQHVLQKCKSYAPRSLEDAKNMPQEQHLEMRRCISEEADHHRNKLTENRARISQLCYQKWTAQSTQTETQWFSSHKWCPTCNLMKNSTCSSLYMFFNSHREWRREFLCLPKIDLLPPPDQNGKTILETVEAKFVDELDYCAEEHVDTIMTEDNFQRAEQEHDKAVQEIKEKKDEKYRTVFFANNLSVFDVVKQLGTEELCRPIAEEYRLVSVSEEDRTERPQHSYDILLDQFVTLLMLRSVSYGQVHSKYQSKESRKSKSVDISSNVNAALQLYKGIGRLVEWEQR